MTTTIREEEEGNRRLIEALFPGVKRNVPGPDQSFQDQTKCGDCGSTIWVRLWWGYKFCKRCKASHPSTP